MNRRITAVTLTQSIQDHLKGLAHTGTLSPGDRLPPERELAASLGVRGSVCGRPSGQAWMYVPQPSGPLYEEGALADSAAESPLREAARPPENASALRASTKDSRAR